MKSTLLSIVLAFFFIAVLTAQNKYSDAILVEAKKSADAQLAYDIDGYMNYMHPKVIEMGGGIDLVKGVVNEQLTTYQKMNVEVVSITHGDPGPVVQAGAELHCILSATTKLKQGEAEFDSVNNWLAVSSDEGASWTFIDLAYYNEGSLKIYLPDYNPTIVFPQN